MNSEELIFQTKKNLVPKATVYKEVVTEAIRLAVACEDEIGVFVRPNCFIGLMSMQSPFWLFADVKGMCIVGADGVLRDFNDVNRN